MTDDEVLDRAIAILRRLKNGKLWMTSRGVAERLRRQDDSIDLTQMRVYERFLKERDLGKGNRRVRNSQLPSAKTLETLWAAIKTSNHSGGVEEADVSSPIFSPSLTTTFDDGNQSGLVTQNGNNEEIADCPKCFLSYNFNDQKNATYIAETLEKKGYSVWVASAQIRKDQNINGEVISAMNEAKKHFIYLSPCSVRSLWVGKEVLAGISRKLEQIIIIEDKDNESIELFKAWMEGYETIATERFERERQGISLQAAKEFHSSLIGYAKDSERPIYVFSAADGNLKVSLPDGFKALKDIPEERENK